MRKFITELKGKTVMTNDGQILGMIENFLVNTSSGDIPERTGGPGRGGRDPVVQDRCTGPSGAAVQRDAGSARRRGDVGLQRVNLFRGRRPRRRFLSN